MTVAPRKKKQSPAVMGHNSLRCLNCGEELKFPISSKGPGFSIAIVAALAKAFDKEHRGHKPSDEGRKRFVFTTPEEWARSWDTGTSSATLWSVMTGKPTFMGGHGAPRDPADFGRCYRLLKAFPEWVARMPEVAARYPEWRMLVAHWAEMTELYETELPTGSAPKLYAMMQGCRP